MDSLFVPVALIFGVLVCVGICLLVWKMSRSRLLSAADARIVLQNWQHAQQTRDPVLQILEADKVLDLALTKLGYQGSLGDKLKKAGPRFGDLQGLWNAHKLRNTAAHELQTNITSEQSARAMRAFGAALRDLGMK